MNYVTMTDIFGQIMEIVIVNNYLKIVFKNDNHDRKKTFTLYVVVLTGYILSKILLSNEAANAVLVIGLLVIFFTFDTKLVVRIASPFIILALFIAVETFTGLLFAFIHGYPIKELTENSTIYIQVVILSKLLSLVAVQIFGYFSGGIGTGLSKKIFIALISLPIATTFLVYSLAGVLYYTDSNAVIFSILIMDKDFVRCHNSCVVNLNNIKEINPETCEIEMRSGVICPASSRKIKAILKAFENK